MRSYAGTLGAMSDKKPKKPSKPPKPLEERSDNDRRFARKMLQCRNRLGWSQARLGSVIGMHQGRIHAWENGIGRPRPKELVTLADKFGVPLRYLADDSIESVEDVEGRPDLIPGLTEDQRFVLRIVESIGVRAAVVRLLGPPDRDDAGEPGRGPDPSIGPPVFEGPNLTPRELRARAEQEAAGQAARGVVRAASARDLTPPPDPAPRGAQKK
jgi:transcriptional regulator with XRE-family HTH domain